MIRSKYLLKVLIVVSISLLVTVVESGKTRNKVYRQNLWNPDPINRVSEGNDAPRFDYDTGYATGLAMKKTLGLTKVVLSPIVIPMILFVGIALLVFFAVVGSSAVVGGAIGRHRVPYKSTVYARELSSRTAKLASEVLSSDQCIERVSCEVAKRARILGAENLIMSAIQEIPSGESVIGRISRSAKNPSNCQKFSCHSLSVVSRALHAFRG